MFRKLNQSRGSPGMEVVNLVRIADNRKRLNKNTHTLQYGLKSECKNIKKRAKSARAFNELTADPGSILNVITTDNIEDFLL